MGGFSKIVQLLLIGEEAARLLVDVLSTNLGVPTKNVIDAMLDRASINSVAKHTVRALDN